jgi:hypothetical protein
MSGPDLVFQPSFKPSFYQEVFLKPLFFDGFILQGMMSRDWQDGRRSEGLVQEGESIREIRSFI